MLGARVRAYYHGKIFDYKENENLFKFEGSSLTEWLIKVGAVEYLGKTYALNIAPMPRAPIMLPQSPNMWRVISQAVMRKSTWLLGWAWVISMK